MTTSIVVTVIADVVAHVVAVVPPMPTAGRGSGDLALWVSAPLLIALVAFAVWTRRR